MKQKYDEDMLSNANVSMRSDAKPSYLRNSSQTPAPQRP